MVKIMYFPLICCFGLFIGSFSSDVNAIRSSTTDAAASRSPIENVKSFSSHNRDKRALALLVPLDYAESADEHHKSKRCWKAQPVQKVRLSSRDPENNEDKIYKLSRPAKYQDARYSMRNSEVKQLSRAGDKSEEVSLESNESFEDHLSRKYPYLKLVPLKNGRKDLKEFFDANSEIRNDNLSNESEGNTEEAILKRIRSHLNSDNYNVLALVGKRIPGNSSLNKQKKYVCYCRENNCSGDSCQRAMYRPCLTCKNSRPSFIGNVNSRYCANVDDARVPLNIQYPEMRNEFLKYPMDNNVQLSKKIETSYSKNGVNNDSHERVQQNLTPVENRRFPSSYDTPKVTLTNPNKNISPLDSYRILKIPIPGKPVVENRISSSKIPTNAHLQAPGNPTDNEYRYGNSIFMSPTSNYPFIERNDNVEIPKNSHQTNAQNFNRLYQSSNGFNGQKFPFANQEIVGFRQPGLPETQISRTLYPTQPEMRTNLHFISDNAFYNKNHGGNGLSWNLLNGMRTDGYPQRQNIQGQIGTSDYHEKLQPSPISPSLGKSEFYGDKNQRLENDEDNSEFNFKAEEYEASTEGNRDLLHTSLDTKNYRYNYESGENRSEDEAYEDKTEERNRYPQINNSRGSIHENIAQTDDQRNANYFGVTDEPEKYQFPITFATEMANTQQEVHNNRNSIKIENTNGVINTDHKLSATKSPNYDDDMIYSTEETIPRESFGEPTNEHSILHQYNDDTIGETIMKPEDEDDANYHSTYDNWTKTTKSHDDKKLVGAEPKYTVVKESDQLLNSDNDDTESLESTSADYSGIEVRDRYFNSKAYDDFGGTSDEDISVKGTLGRYDLVEHGVNTHHGNSNDKELHDLSRNENIGIVGDVTTTIDDYVENKKFDLKGEEFDESSMKQNNQFLGVDVANIITSTETSLQDDQVVSTIQSAEFNEPDDKTIKSWTKAYTDEIPQTDYQDSYEVYSTTEKDNPVIIASTKTGSQDHQVFEKVQPIDFDESNDKVIESSTKTNIVGEHQTDYEDSYEVHSTTEENTPITIGSTKTGSQDHQVVGKIQPIEFDESNEKLIKPTIKADFVGRHQTDYEDSFENSYEVHSTSDEGAPMILSSTKTSSQDHQFIRKVQPIEFNNNHDKIIESSAKADIIRKHPTDYQDSYEVYSTMEEHNPVVIGSTKTGSQDHQVVGKIQPIEFDESNEKLIKPTTKADIVGKHQTDYEDSYEVHSTTEENTPIIIGSTKTDSQDHQVVEKIQPIEFDESNEKLIKPTTKADIVGRHQTDYEDSFEDSYEVHSTSEEGAPMILSSTKTSSQDHQVIRKVQPIEFNNNHDKNIESSVKTDIIGKHPTDYQDSYEVYSTTEKDNPVIIGSTKTGSQDHQIIGKIQPIEFNKSNDKITESSTKINIVGEHQTDYQDSYEVYSTTKENTPIIIGSTKTGSEDHKIIGEIQPIDYDESDEKIIKSSTKADIVGDHQTDYQNSYEVHSTSEKDAPMILSSTKTTSQNHQVVSKVQPIEFDESDNKIIESSTIADTVGEHQTDYQDSYELYSTSQEDVPMILTSTKTSPRDHQAIGKVQPTEFNKNHDTITESSIKADIVVDHQTDYQKSYELYSTTEENIPLIIASSKTDSQDHEVVGKIQPIELNKSNDNIIKSSSATDIAGNQQTDCQDSYKLHLTTEKDTPVLYEEDMREAKDDLSPFSDYVEDTSERLLSEHINTYSINANVESTESYEDVSNSEDCYSTEYSTVNSLTESSNNLSESPNNDKILGTKNENYPEAHRIDSYPNHIQEEHPDAGFNNSPTKYFSPNDRVLEYIKKHSQNLVRYSNSDNDDQRRTESTLIYSTPTGHGREYVVPEIYHTNEDQYESNEPEFQGSDSSLESDEILEQQTNYEKNWTDNQSQNSNGQTRILDIEASQEFPASHEEETFVQGPRYEEQNNGQLSDLDAYKPKPELTIFNELEGKDFVGISKELGKPLSQVHPIKPDETLTKSLVRNENMKGSEDYKDYNVETTYSSKVDINKDDETYEAMSDFDNSEENKSGKEFTLTSEHREKSSGDEIRATSNSNEKSISIFNLMPSGKENPDEITESYEDNTKESKSVEVLGNVQAPSNFDYETTEISKEYETIEDSTETNGDFDTDEQSYGVIESPRESMATEIPKNVPAHYNTDSGKSNEAPSLVGNPQELNNQKSSITHLGEGLSSRNSDFTEYSMSTESSTDYSAEDLSTNKYTEYYNGRDNVESTTGSTSSCSYQVSDKISTTENYDNNKGFLVGKYLNSISEEDLDTNVHNKAVIPPNFPNNYNSSEENVSTLEVQTNANNRIDGEAKPDGQNLLPETNSGINSLAKTTRDQYVGIRKHDTQSTTENSKSNDVSTQNEHASHHTVESNEEDYSISTTDDGTDEYNVDTGKYNPIESQRSSEGTTKKDVEEDETYYTTQETQNVDNFHSTGASEAQNKSTHRIEEEEVLSEGYESKKNSEEAKNAEIVGDTRSTGSCTKPPEVTDDIGYLGRILPKKSNRADVNSLKDLVDSDLYYIGDGVRLPLAIKKLKDGSFALSISDKICEQRLKEKCPCCVPREGRILQEKRDEFNAEDITEKTEPSNLRRRAVREDKNSEDHEEKLVADGEILSDEQHRGIREPTSDDAKERVHRNKRITRSITMPVDEFAEKYNLLLDLNDQMPDEIEEIPLRHNVIERDNLIDGSKEHNNDLVESIVLLNDQVPKNAQADDLLTTLNKIITTEPKEVILGAMNEMKKELQGIESKDDQIESRLGVQMAQYGYQRDNPILDRIKIIKEMQKAKNRCEHKYQKNCDDAIAQKTELLKMILYWLKDLVTNKPN